MVSRAKEAEISQEDEDLIVATVAEAVDGLLAMRRAEGDELRSVVDSCVQALADVRQSIARRRQETVAEMQTDLAERVRSLLAEVGAEFDGSDEGRLVQEVAYLAERSDVREELDRLDSHLEQVRSLLDSEEAIGRRLDFLSQELLRELNTIGSKCRDAATTSLVVDGKVVCDQFREQAQNIE